MACRRQKRWTLSCATTPFRWWSPATSPSSIAATADEVILRRWISGFNTALPMQLLEGSDLWVLTMDLPPGLALRVQVRGGAKRRPRTAAGRAQRRGGARPVRRQLGLPGLRLRAAGLDPARSRRPQPAAWSTCRCTARLSVPGATWKFTCRRASSATAATRCWWCTTARTTCATPTSRRVLDNLIHRLEIPAMIVALTPVPRSPGRVHRRSAASAFHRRRTAARPGRRLPADRRSGRARPDGRQPGRRRRPAHRQPVSRSASASCCCSPAPSPSATSATTRKARCSTRWCVS